MNLAQLLIDTGKFAEAHERLVRADAVFARVFGEDHPVRAAIAGNLGGVELKQHHWDAAQAHYRRAVAILERLQGPDSPDVFGARRDVARALAEAGHMDDALGEQQPRDRYPRQGRSRRRFAPW